MKTLDKIITDIKFQINESIKAGDNPDDSNWGEGVVISRNDAELILIIINNYLNGK